MLQADECRNDVIIDCEPSRTRTTDVSFKIDRLLCMRLLGEAYRESSLRHNFLSLKPLGILGSKSVAKGAAYGYSILKRESCNFLGWA